MHAPSTTLIQRAARALAPRTRRGTVLLLVLGSLALVLILAVVYAAIGKGDRRTARTLRERQDAQANVDVAAAHIIGVVGIDVFNLVPEVSDFDALDILGRTTPLMRREAVDLPVTDFFFTSVPSLLDGVGGNQNTIDQMRFRPDGGHSADIIWDRPPVSIAPFDLPAFASNDPRSANDPFLAATRPVDLGAKNGLTLDLPPYLRKRDWSQISNLAPDGRFVNLYYLRQGTGAGSGFRASSLDLTRDPGSNRSRLRLFDADGAPTDELPFADMTGAGGPEDADWNKPMHWTMFQRHLFRPVNDPAYGGTTLGNPGDADYWAYQYADADGDGFLDSRWFELVDFSNHLQPVSLLGDSDMRFFIAARAIDLSSLVNVATATDFLTPSTLEHRIGAGPQDISLFKLLHATEHALEHASPAEAAAGGVFYADAFETGTGQPGDYGSFDDLVSQAIGRKAYLRLRDGALQGRVRPFGEVPGEVNPGRALSNDLRDYTTNLEPDDRADYSASVGSVYPGVTAGGNSRTAPFSTDDLVELLTFHGINDDRNFSTLEQAMAAANTGNIPSTTYSWLRSDRPTSDDAWLPTTFAPLDAANLKYMRSAVDMRRMLTTVSGARPLRSGILQQASSFVELTEAADRKLLLDSLVVGSGRYANNADGNTINQLRQEQSRLISNAFGVYLSALAPEIRESDWDLTSGLGAGGEPNPTEVMTQFYGHMGPELAVRLAGHMALNFRDMADAPFIDINPRDGIPDVPTLLDLDLSNTANYDQYKQRVDEPSVAVLRLAQDWNPATATGPMRELWDAGLKLDIDEVYGAPAGTSFIAGGGSVVSHAAMMLYGNEPQPFLSQVSSMTMYTDFNYGFQDIDGGTSPDPEWMPSTINAGDGPDGIPDNDDDFDGLPNIRGEVDATNDDFLFQALFVQIFNPFDVPIVLDRYYIEFADSFYSFSDGTPGAPPVVLAPRSTMVVWASNPGDSLAIDDRLSNAGVTFGGIVATGSSYFETMIRQQLGTGVEIRRLAKRYASPGGLSVSGTYSEVLAGDVRDLFHEDPSAKSDANRVAMLWRDNHNIASPATGLIDWAATNLNTPDRATDQLVDRLRDTSDIPVVGRSIVGASRAALDRRLDLPTLMGPNREMQVNNAVRGNATNRAGPDLLPGAAGNNYNHNAQLTVALWGNISRKDDATFNTGTSAVDYYAGNVPGTGDPGDYDVTGTPVGALPAKVFEPTASSTATYDPYAESTFLKHEIKVAGDGTVALPEELSLIDDFAYPPAATPTPTITSSNISQFWNGLQTAAIVPEFFAGLAQPVFGRTGAATLSMPISASVNPDFGSYEGSRYIRMTVNQTEFRDLVSGRRTLRVGDMLLPLAVGAYRTPLEPDSTGSIPPQDGQYSADVAQRLRQYEAQWTTLGEALAAAMGYSDSVGPGGGVATTGPRDPFRSLAFDHRSGFPQPKRQVPTGPATNAILPYVLDRGQLRLDAFVPFMDMDLNGRFDQGTDFRRGLGIPMALNLFETAQAGTDLGLAALGGLDRPVMGTINLNTADPEVLRLHPALAMDMYDLPNATPQSRLWWPRTLQQLTLNSPAYRLNLFQAKPPPPPSTQPARNVSFADVGSYITAYRDPARSTRLKLPGPIAGGSGSVLVDAFRYTLVDPGSPELGLLIDRRPDADFLTNTSAEQRSGIDNIRSGQGLLSVGELFAARDLKDDLIEHQMGGFARDTRTIGVGFIDQRNPNNQNYLRGTEFYQSIDAAKINELRAGQIQIANFGNHLTGDLLGLAANFGGGTLTTPNGNGDAYPGLPGGDALPIMPDQIPDSYDEQLVQLSALLNSVGVRSDYYAVWFVVHGYRESDTVGLSPADPLVPSFAARYLLILDRSNVVKKGDQPRVLAYVQLPMLPPPPAPGTF